MTFRKLSNKQKQVFRWCYKGDYKAIICDGAVRSGKTVCMITSFVLWAMKRFDGAVFGICGKTVRSAERNIITPLMSIADITSYFSVSYTRSVNLLTISGMGKRNYFYVFGGKDESSYTLIQGITLSGVFFDEVALMPRSFVEQALTRTLSVPESLYWFNCNPESRFHWFYQEWILKAEERNALHLHFLMSDNPTLSAEQINAAEKMFSGVFHQRYIEGLWVSAEGVIYKQFADNPEDYIITDEWLAAHSIIYGQIGVDFGGTKSAHAFCFTGFTTGFREVVVINEYYLKEHVSPSRVERDFVDFTRRIQSRYLCYTAFMDSAEQTLIAGMEAAIMTSGVNIDICNAAKNPINDRIAFFCSMMAQGRFKIHESCRNTIEALQSAVYDDKHKTEDVRLDDGIMNIDSLDAMEYSVENVMRDITYLRGD